MTAPPISVILIREWEAQMSSSGCCGRVEGDFLLRRGERCFPERRRIMEEAGALYRSVQERFGDAARIHVVDPRNLPALIFLVVRDSLRYGRGPWAALRTLFGISVPSMVVNGRLTAWKQPPGPELAEMDPDESGSGRGEAGAPAS